MKKHLMLILVVISLVVSSANAQKNFLNESFTFLGSEKFNMGLGALSLFMSSTEKEVSSFLKFPLLINYNVNNFNRIRLFYNPGLYVSSINENAIYASLNHFGLEYSYFIARNNTSNFSIKLKQNMIKSNLDKSFQNITSLQCLYEYELIYTENKDNYGSVRIFAGIGGYYLYNTKVGGFSLLAGLSIGNGIRLSFDFASLIYKSNDIHRFYGSVTNDY